jgi:hypothetical protein
MSEGYAIEDGSGEMVGLVVRDAGERAFRFFSAAKAFDVLDGNIFATPRAAQRAVHEFGAISTTATPPPHDRYREAIP